MPWILSLGFLWSTISLANPYPDPNLVPKDPPWSNLIQVDQRLSLEELGQRAREVLRLRIDWDEASDSFHLGKVVREFSGTSSFLARSKRPNPLGSYQGSLVDPETGLGVAFDSIGTGQEFRKLTRALTFRFPVFEKPMIFKLVGENPVTGQMEELLREVIDPLPPARSLRDALGNGEVRLVKEATKSPEIILNVYAEGYQGPTRTRFFNDAAKVLDVLQRYNLPLLEHFRIQAVFEPSKLKIGRAQDLGLPVQERDTFLGLYFPYWNNFGRWYHVLYPTSEERYREAIGRVSYDYPLILIDSADYYGVGNYRELTAVPARSSQFGFLLMHELGHFFGLNEEYESGGKTELAFAPGIHEPFSQNITFLRDPNQLKWNRFVRSETPLPTPRSSWTGQGPFGAYVGGYAETEPLNTSHKPGLECTMEKDVGFCPICLGSIRNEIVFDMGM